MSSANTATDIETRITQKEEKLRKLKLVQLHRSKNESANLEESIRKWRDGCQEALRDLLAKIKELNSETEEVTMEKLLQRLGIDPTLVQYSTEDENFF